MGAGWYCMVLCYLIVVSLSSLALHWVAGEAHTLIPGPDGTDQASPPYNQSLQMAALLIVLYSILLAGVGGELLLLSFSSYFISTMTCLLSFLGLISS